MFVFMVFVHLNGYGFILDAYIMMWDIAGQSVLNRKTCFSTANVGKYDF